MGSVGITVSIYRLWLFGSRQVQKGADDLVQMQQGACDWIDIDVLRLVGSGQDRVPGTGWDILGRERPCSRGEKILDGR